MARENALRLGAACLTALALLAVSVPATHAAVKEQVDYVFPDPNTALGEPDPAVWAQSGNLEPNPVDGLKITDPGSGGQLLYFHPSTHASTGQFLVIWRAIVKMEPVPDPSDGWAGDVIGFRLILDDTSRRLVLGLGRDPATKARQVLVLQTVPGAAPVPLPGVPAIPFNWENGQFNVFEIGRSADGGYTFSAATAGSDPVTRIIPAASLPPSVGSAVFLWGMDAFGGGTSTWQEVHGSVFEAQTDIGLDTRRLELDLSEGAIKWRGEITLPAGVTLNPPTEPVTVKLANASKIVFEFSIPAGGFQPKGKHYRFETPPGATPGIRMNLKQKSDTIWNFHVWNDNVALHVTDPTSITGTIAFSNKVGTQTMPLTDRGDRLVYKRDPRDDDSDRELTIASGAPEPGARSNVLRLLPNTPNPFREGTVLAFELEAVTDVTIEIFDVAGRRLSVDHLGRRARGINHHFFGGRDQDGQLLRSGVYFARISTASAVQTQRLVIVR